MGRVLSLHWAGPLACAFAACALALDPAEYTGGDRLGDSGTVSNSAPDGSADAGSATTADDAPDSAPAPCLEVGNQLEGAACVGARQLLPWNNGNMTGAV